MTVAGFGPSVVAMELGVTSDGWGALSIYKDAMLGLFHLSWVSSSLAVLAALAWPLRAVAPPRQLEAPARLLLSVHAVSFLVLVVSHRPRLLVRWFQESELMLILVVGGLNALGFGLWRLILRRITAPDLLHVVPLEVEEGDRAASPRSGKGTSENVRIEPGNL